MALEIEQVPLRSGTTTDWATSGLILGVGELGVNTTTNEMKLGDGVTAFEGLDAI